MSIFSVGYQSFGNVAFIVIVGFVVGKFQWFNIMTIRPILNIVQIIGLSIMFFKYFSIAEFTFSFWCPFLITAIVQVVVHIFSFLYFFFILKEDWKIYFFAFHYGVPFRDFASVGYVLVQAIYGDSFLYIPLEMQIVDCLIVYPIHFVLLHFRGEEITDHDLSDENKTNDDENDQKNEKEKIDDVEIIDETSESNSDEDHVAFDLEEKFEHSNMTRFLVILSPEWILAALDIILAGVPPSKKS
jgi:predicted permease